MRWQFVLLLAVSVLAACAPAPMRRGADAQLLSAQAAREATLAADPFWALSGRLAVSDGRDGGSGRIEWQQKGQDFDIRLSAPVSRQSWRLVREAGWARLEGLESGPLAGPDAQALLYQATGWLIPVDALAAWVRGVRAEGDSELEFGQEGLPALLLQDGWTVEFRAWDATAQPARPLRVFATQGEARVRLQVDSWRDAVPAGDVD
jgi:outer membrane lipoprotein LolB